MAQRKDSYFLSQLGKKREFKPKSNIKGNKTDDMHLPKCSGSGEEKVKKPFNKKVYRFKKYSNKYQLNKWEDQRKKKVLRNYYKEIKNDSFIGKYRQISFDDNSENETDIKSIPVHKTVEKTDETILGQFVRHPDFKLQSKDQVDKKDLPHLYKTEIMPKINSKAIKKDAFWKAKEEFNRIKLSKEENRMTIEQSKKEREAKLVEYKKKKADRFKKLSQKTRKGQPVMTGRLELLLEKIEQTHK